jgi:hypothetical protein
MVTLTVFKSPVGRWMVRTDNKAVPPMLRVAVVDYRNEHYFGGPRASEVNAERVRTLVESCNPGCRVVLENSNAN